MRTRRTKVSGAAAVYFCGTAGAVTEEMIKEYVENQDEGKELFKITD